MTPDEATQIVDESVVRTRQLFRLLSIAPEGTPLRHEIRRGLLESMDWANDDDVIDALYDAWWKEQRERD